MRAASLLVVVGSTACGGPASLSEAGTACRNWHSPLPTLRKIDQHDIRVVSQPIENDALAVGEDVECSNLALTRGPGKLGQLPRLPGGQIQQPEYPAPPPPSPSRTRDHGHPGRNRCPPEKEPANARAGGQFHRRSIGLNRLQRGSTAGVLAGVDDEVFGRGPHRVECSPGRQGERFAAVHGNLEQSPLLSAPPTTTHCPSGDQSEVPATSMDSPIAFG